MQGKELPNPGISVEFNFRESTSPSPDLRHPEKKNIDEIISEMFALSNEKGLGGGYVYNQPGDFVIINVGLRPVALR